MSEAPTIVRAGGPEGRTWDDPEHGRGTYRTRIDAAAGPTSGMVMATVDIPAAELEAPHEHDRPEMVYVLSGGGTVRFHERETRVDAGDTVFVPSGTVHSWHAGEEGLMLLSAFPADRFDEVAYRWAQKD